MSADWPFQRSFASTSAPWASSTRIASTLPMRAAVMSGVSPSGEAALTSAPAFSSVSIIAAFPLVQANASGVTP